MKYVRLTENLVIRPDIRETKRGRQDNHSYVVGKLAVNNDGDEFIKDPKYFTRLDYALEYAVDEAIRNGMYDGKYNTLKELSDAFKRLRNEFREALGILDEPEVKDY